MVGSKRLRRGGLTIQTTLDPRLQRAAEAAEKPQSLWGDVWYSLKCNHFAMASLVILGILVVIAIVTAIAPGILPYDPYAQNLSQSFQAPSAAHWFGTDQQGRDIFSRILIGSQISLSVGLLAVATATSAMASVVRLGSGEPSCIS